MNFNWGGNQRWPSLRALPQHVASFTKTRRVSLSLLQPDNGNPACKLEIGDRFLSDPNPHFRAPELPGRVLKFSRVGKTVSILPGHRVPPLPTEVLRGCEDNQRDRMVGGDHGMLCGSHTCRQRAGMCGGECSEEIEEIMKRSKICKSSVL